MRNVSSETIEYRTTEWLSIIASAKGPLIEAQDLYKGGHWKVAKELICGTGEHNSKVELWICSAGYGLIPPVARISAYGATFARGHQDSISNQKSPTEFRNENQEWWKRLSFYDGPCPGQPRSVAQLAECYPSTPMMVVGSNDYIDAMHRDLLDSAKILKNRDLLVIVSAGSNHLEGLSENLIPCDKRLQSVLGGACQSLNVRMARKILNENNHDGIRASMLIDRYVQLLEKQPKLIPFGRKSVDDKTVTIFIMVSLQQNSGLSHSQLLRQFRDSGFACEQSRFRRLFRQIIKETERDFCQNEFAF